MNIFDTVKDAISILYKDSGLMAFENDCMDRKIPFVSRSLIWDEKRTSPERAIGDMDSLGALIKDAIGGVKNLDALIEEAKWMRACLARRVFEMRHGFMPHKSALVNRLYGIATDKEDSSCLDKIVADILGYDKLPDRMINLSTGLSRDGNQVYIFFDVQDSPTSIIVVMPREVDFRMDRHVPDGEEELERITVDDLRDYVDTDIHLIVNTGSMPKCGDYEVSSVDNIESCCANFDQLRDKLEKAMDIDVRNRIKAVRDIDQVETLEDFAAWRQLRAADRTAARHARKSTDGSHSGKQA